MKKIASILISAIFLFPAFSQEWDKTINVGHCASFSTFSVAWGDFGDVTIIDSDLDGKGLAFDFQTRGVNSSNFALLLDYNFGFSKIDISDGPYNYSLNGFGQTFLLGLGYRLINTNRIEAIISVVQGLSTYLVFGDETIEGLDTDFRLIMNTFNLGGDFYLSFAFSENIRFYLSGTTVMTLAGTASMKVSVENIGVTIKGNPETGGISFIPRIGFVFKI